MVFLLFIAAMTQDLTAYDPGCGVAVKQEGDLLRVDDLAIDMKKHTFTLAGIEFTPKLTVTTGARTDRANERYTFFDKPKVTKRSDAALEWAVRAVSDGKRVAITIGKLTAGPFHGEFVVTRFAGSPLVRFDAAMTLEEKLVAYFYEFALEGDFDGAKEKHRIVTANGKLALFPPPHAFFFPRDWTNDFGFTTAKKGRISIRQLPDGGGAFVPWFDAPAGRTQHMTAFVCAADKADSYTRGDVFKPMEGRLTMTSHWHSRLAISELDGKPKAPEFVAAFKAIGVNLVHLAEFHGDGHPDDGGETRLKEMKSMFDVCRKYSDDQLLLLPGEEWNRHLGNPKPKEHPGHWMYLFPKPVYCTKVRAEKQEFVEEVKGYGAVYHVGSKDDMVALLEKEKGLAWVAHPRIKASFATPDAFKDEPFFKADFFLGAAWKAMPGDLSERLGRRALDVLDDMRGWGHKKMLLGEVDCFEVDRSHELYGAMNVNYLKLAKKPTVDDWSPVLDALRAGDFFVTTGEILIHSFEAKAGKVSVELEWTFPLDFVEIVSAGKRKTIRMSETGEHGRKRFEWEMETGAWVRVEAWDVAGNGAFTQPQ